MSRRDEFRFRSSLIKLFKSTWREPGPAFALGLLIGCFYSLIALVSDIKTLGQGAEYVVGLLSLVGTLIAAGIAWVAVQRQIADARGVEDRRRQGSSRAASALLPIALADAVKCSEINIRRSFDAACLIYGHPPAHELAGLSQETIRILRECIEFADDELLERLSYIIRAYQILTARNERVITLPRMTTTEQHPERIEDSIDWAVVHAVAASIFPLARGGRNSLQDWGVEHVQNGFANAGLHFDDFPMIGERVDSRAAHGVLKMRFER